MKNVLFSILLLLGLTNFSYSQEFRGAAAHRLIPGANMVVLQANTKIPSYIQFDASHQQRPSSFMDYAYQNLGLDSQLDQWTLLRAETDVLGHRHERYQQRYQGIPVEGSMIILHINDNKVYAINGEHFKINNEITTQSRLSEAAALQGALAHIGALKYKWEVLGQEVMLRRLYDLNPQLTRKTTYFPEGELVIIPENGNFREMEFRLAWKFDVYGHKPLSRHDVYVDALTGKVLWKEEKIHTADALGTAATHYSGTRNITTDSFFGGFRLRESGRGNGIQTWNMQSGTDATNAVDFTNSTNNWTSTANLDDAATDAHWGAEMTYDFYDTKFGRNSIDNNGFALLSYVHYGNNFANAFWDGSQMTYGDGNNNPFTALDIAGHEITHGLTTFTADLIYRDESGALNESFSDIFGKSIEHFARPNNFSWEIGVDLSFVIRDMQDPRNQGDPRNYNGTNWFTGAGDNGGVHTNSGVQNHWFYLLVNGGTGTNDFNENYNVTVMGFDTASAIAFRNLTVYLTPSSNYADARRFAIQSAIDLYGPCSVPHEATTNAWHAVGVGRPFSRIPIAAFGALTTSTCSQPYTISFTDSTASALNYLWSFGDGDTSSMPAPSHTYTSPGMYNVTLAITGICGGGDTTARNAFVDIQAAPAAPVVSSVSAINCGSRVTLNATASNQINWYDAANNLVAQGSSFATPKLTATTDYFVQHVKPDAPQFGGPVDHSFGAGGFHNSGFNSRLNFTVYKSLRLKSIWVDAGSAGARTIVLEDAAGNQLQSVTVNIPAGGSRITLDFDLTAGNYMIGGSNVDLYRNNSGATFPYDIPGALSITGSNAGSGFYYYLYDWMVETSCQSARVAVNIPVIPLVDPLIADIDRCGAGSVTFVATNTSGGVVNWYDVFNNYLGTGQSFTTPSLTTTTSYFAEHEVGPLPQSVGPVNATSIGSGGYHNNGFNARLFFEVHQPIRIKSVWVDAGSDGVRDIFVEDQAGNPVSTTSLFIAQGKSRLQVNIDLQPGTYQIGGSNMDLFRNDGGAQYPYEIQNLVSITGANAFTNPGFYYYLYDWEVQAAPCFSNRVQVTANVNTGTAPTSSFSFTNTNRVLTFQDLSTGATSWLWSFGDGATSTLQNPTHTYTAAGTYVIALNVSNGSCTESSNQTLLLEPGVAIDPLLAQVNLKLYPNPGNGRFTVAANLDQVAEMQLEVFDALGRSVYASPVRRGRAFKQLVELQDASAGTYIVKFSLNGKSIFRKYLMK